ncbi:MAG: hypothetical protein ACOH2M_03350 [Cypionkella sp.]
MAQIIPIELLKAPTRIHRADDFDFGPFGSFAEVQDVEFDGYGYTVTARMIDPDYGYATDHEVQFVVDAGQSVDFGGVGEPKLRTEGDVSDEEWEAKGQPLTLEAATASFCDMLVSRKVDALLNQAAADAIGVSALMAAE